ELGREGTGQDGRAVRQTSGLAEGGVGLDAHAQHEVIPRPATPSLICRLFGRLAMNLRFHVWLLATAAVALFATAISAADKKPNVIVILADDVGYGEFGFQGNKEIPTPHIDAIAKNGVRFTNGYIAATYCSPCRAGLMTGRYPTRFGHEFNGGGPAGLAGSVPFGLPLSEKTLADRLKALGYATCAVGKWHLGGRPQFLATARGFDEFYGTVANTPYFNPPNFIDTRVSTKVTPVKDPNFYTTDAYAARAVDWIGKQQ